MFPTNIGTQVRMCGHYVVLNPTWGQRTVPNANEPTNTRRWLNIGSALYTQRQRINYYPFQLKL